MNNPQRAEALAKDFGLAELLEMLETSVLLKAKGLPPKHAAELVKMAITMQAGLGTLLVEDKPDLSTHCKCSDCAAHRAHTKRIDEHMELYKARKRSSPLSISGQHASERLAGQRSCAGHARADDLAKVSASLDEEVVKHLKSERFVMIEGAAPLLFSHRARLCAALGLPADKAECGEAIVAAVEEMEADFTTARCELDALTALRLSELHGDTGVMWCMHCGGEVMAHAVRGGPDDHDCPVKSPTEGTSYTRCREHLPERFSDEL